MRSILTAIGIVAVLLPLNAVPSLALSKGLLDPLPAPVAMPIEREAVRPAEVDISYIPAVKPMPANGEQLAVEVGSQLGRVASSWSEGTSLPFLGSLVSGIVRIGRRAYGVKETMQDRYGVTMRSYGSGGVAVMYRRRF